MIERFEVTAEGKAALEAEFKLLTDETEPDLVTKLADAASQGDLRENFAYHDIRRELGLVRGRIAELKRTLAGATVVAAPKNDGTVRVGSVIVIQEEGEDLEETFTVVSEAEAGKQRADGIQSVSVSSPMGAALIGKKIGQTAHVRTPTGATIPFKINAVR